MPRLTDLAFPLTQLLLLQMWTILQLNFEGQRHIKV
jgi:hypothetical protein